MTQPAEKPPKTDGPTKSDLIRDAIVFQFKLFVDGVRDFVLIPVSLIAAVISFLRPGGKAGTEFYDVVAFGRTTERKINLFSVADRVNVEPVAEELPDLDALVGDIETFVKKEYSGERFAPARERLNKLLNSMQEPKPNSPHAEPDSDAD